jgi:hypothetical protein
MHMALTKPHAKDPLPGIVPRFMSVPSSPLFVLFYCFTKKKVVFFTFLGGSTGVLGSGSHTC